MKPFLLMKLCISSNKLFIVSLKNILSIVKLDFTGLMKNSYSNKTLYSSFFYFSYYTKTFYCNETFYCGNETYYPFIETFYLFVET